MRNTEPSLKKTAGASRDTMARFRSTMSRQLGPNSAPIGRISSMAKHKLSGARKAMSRKQRRALEEPCRALLDQDAVSLRQWAQAASYGADRFGLLAAGDLARVLPLVAEDAASAEGVKKLAENRVKACGRIPRCKEIVAFALSRDSLGALRDLGLEGPSNGGGA